MVGCGGDGGSAPSAPTPAPAPAPAPTPPPPPPACTVGLVLQAGDSCTYPGSSQTFTVNADGSATLGPITSGQAINITSANLDFAATRQSDGSWIIERVAGSGPTPTPTPQPTTDTFSAGERIPNFPTGIPNRTSGASFSLVGGSTTITMQRGGYVQYGDIRFTCEASECRIENGLVTAGTVVRTGAGAEPVTGSGGCTIEDLGTLGTASITRGGSLGRDCVSPDFTGELARYYSFRLRDRAEVQIDLEASAFDAWVALRRGAAISGDLVAADDDGGSGLDSRLVVELSPGTYTIEATSAQRGRAVTGDFTLTVTRRSGATTGDPVELEGELMCSVTPVTSGSSVYNASVSGRVRATRSLSSVTVTGRVIERDGAQRQHTLTPDHLGSMSVGEIKSFSSTGIITTDATRAGCEAGVEWTATGQQGSASFRSPVPESSKPHSKQLFY